nr:putative capsid protein [Myrmica rubra rhabdo-like virus 1]
MNSKIILLGFSMLTSCWSISRPHKEYNVLSIFDDAHFFPYAGIYMEPAGQHLSYSGSITIPFLYVLPSLNMISNEYCPGHEHLVNIHKNVLKHLKTMVNPIIPVRDKRSLIPIVSVLSGGLSVWNTVEIQTIKHKISIMTDQSVHLDNAIGKLTDSQNLVIKQLGEVTAVIGDHAKSINRIINETECMSRLSDEFQMYIASWLYSAPSEFLSAYGGALTGQVTPSLLSVSNLKRVLLKHPDMTNTIYQSEPSTIYEFGQILLTEVYVDNHAHLKGIIQLPKILALAPLPIYNIYSVNVLNKNVDYKYNLPGMVVCPSPGNCWDADNDKCIKKTNRVICLYGTDHTPDSCLSSIMTNSTINCQIDVKHHKDPIVLQTRSGVLLGGANTSYNVFKRIGDIDVPSSVVNKREYAIVITAKDGDWVTVSGNVYSTIISGFDYNFTTYITHHHSDNDLDLGKLALNWKHINELQYDHIRFDKVSGSDGLYILFLTINIVLVMFTLYIFFLIKKKKSSYIQSHPQNSEFIGLR